MKNEPTPPDREVLTGLVERVTYPGYAELVGMKVDVIVVRGRPRCRPPRLRQPKIPIVMVGGGSDRGIGGGTGARLAGNGQGARPCG